MEFASVETVTGRPSLGRDRHLTRGPREIVRCLVSLRPERLFLRFRQDKRHHGRQDRRNRRVTQHAAEHEGSGHGAGKL